MEPTDNVGQRLSELTARSLADQARSIERLHEVLQKIARSEMPQSLLLHGYKNFVRESVPLYFKKVADLGLSFLQSLVSLNEGLNAGLFEHLLGPASQVDPTSASETPAETSGGTATRPRLSLQLQGKLGETVTAGVLIENKRREPAEVSFLISEFYGPQGTDPFRPPLLFDPSQFRLEPGQELPVRLRLPLLPELFVSGLTYETVILVRGPDEQEIHLRVGITANEETATDTAPADAAPRIAESVSPTESPRATAKRRPTSARKTERRTVKPPSPAKRRRGESVKKAAPRRKRD
jgi:hypothetical protein